jgi:hypothetical protein
MQRISAGGVKAPASLPMDTRAARVERVLESLESRSEARELARSTWSGRATISAGSPRTGGFLRVRKDEKRFAVH